MFGWGGFWLLTLIWGSLFLFSRVGIESIDPFHLTFMRLGIAAVGLNLIVIFRRSPIPTDKNSLLHLIIAGIGGLMLPILLLNWGIQTVESGISSVLQATAAIFAAIVAHFIFHDERLSSVKLVGVIISFIGVIVLTQRNVDGAAVQSSLEGQAAIILSALLYAGFTIHSRVIMQRNIKPIVFSALSMLSATYGMGILMLVQISRGHLPTSIPTTLSTQTLGIIIILGLVHSFFAYTLYYEVVKRIGAAHATMVTYSIPPVALILGAIFLNEALDIYIIVGAGLIFFGIILIKLHVFERLRFPTFPI